MRLKHRLHDCLRDQHGFTLAELLVVLCLMAVLSGFFLQSFVFVMTQFQHRMALLELEDNLAMAIDYLVTDGANSIAVKDCNAEQLTLLTEDAVIIYTIGTDLQAKEHFYDLTGKILYRRESTQVNRQPMVNFISGFCVSYYDSTGAATSDPDCVSMVDIQLEGVWNDTVVQKRQIICLKDSDYL